MGLMQRAEMSVRPWDVGPSQEGLSQAPERLLRHMKSSGLWIDDDRHEQIRLHSRHLGSHLRVECGLRSGAKFGPLAFGFEIGLALHAFVAGSLPPRFHAAHLAAVFNHGICLFDQLCDEDSSGAAQLDGLFDHATLAALLTIPDAHLALTEAARRAKGRRVRVLLETIAGFFRYLADNASCGRTSLAFTQLEDALTGAYRAQIHCTSQRHGAPADARQWRLAEDKSTLPFHVFLRLIAVCDAAVAPSAPGDPEDLLAREVARVFWLVDDITDLARDHRTGDVNIIHLRAAADNRSASADLYDALLLAAIEETCTSLAGATEMFRRAHVRSLSGVSFDEVLISYVRKWVEQRGAGRAAIARC